MCKLFDISSQNGTDYLVMEYLEGETLAALVRHRGWQATSHLTMGLNWDAELKK